ncbi:MAG: hypothetical protein N2651_00665, partial [Fimbriimonadales bacterium]|nr:hypothetical protein [Fimbriimonadales bacterium]
MQGVVNRRRGHQRYRSVRVSRTNCRRGRRRYGRCSVPADESSSFLLLRRQFLQRLARHAIVRVYFQHLLVMR